MYLFGKHVERGKKEIDPEKYILLKKKGTAWKTTTFPLPSEHKQPVKGWHRMTKTKLTHSECRCHTQVKNIYTDDSEQHGFELHVHFLTPPKLNYQ